MKPPPQGLPDTDDPYLLLDVRPGASSEQIRRAYLRRVKVWKPDRHPAEFRRVREAYDRLREQEKWFEAWLQAGEVVRRAAEEASHAEGGGSGEPAAEGETEPASDASASASASTKAAHAGAGTEAASDAARAQAGTKARDALRPGHEPPREPDEPPEGDDEEADVEALLAALDEELRADPNFTDDDGDYDDEPGYGYAADDADPVEPAPPVETLEQRRRRAQASERLAALEREVHADLEAGRFAAAADRLLEPGTEAVAAHREFAPLLLEVCCAVVWELPPRFEALAARYGDLVSGHDTAHHDGALLHRRLLVDELPAWRQAVAGWPELHRFLALGSSLRAPAEAELGLRLGRRAAADPSGFLQVLARAAERAPGILALYVTMAERWARSYGRLPLHRPPRARPTVEQAAAALADAAQRHRRVRWEQARPLLVSLAIVLVPLLAPSPVVELMVIGLVILLWAWRAWAREPEARIYARVVRPAAATWLWATHATPDALATALHARLPPPGSWSALLHPGRLGEYPERLRHDLALLGFGATSPMIPLLRAPSSTA